MARAQLLTYADAARQLTRAQWAAWENVGLEPELDLDRLKLHWPDSRVSDLQVKGALTSLQLTRTMEGASTVTMHLRDPEGMVFNARAKRMRTKVDPATAAIRQAFKREPVTVDEGWNPLSPPDLIGRAAEIALDDVVFRLVAVRYSSANQELELTFEDRLVYWLRRKRGAKRASRAHTTRAQFILALLREVKAVQYRYVCPSLNVRQRIAKPDTALSGTTGSGAGITVDSSAQSGGLAPGARVLVGGRPASAAQRRVGEQVLGTADDEGATGKARKALVEACLVESGMANLGHGDASSLGVLQLLASTAKGLGISANDVQACCRAFLRDGFWRSRPRGAIELAKAHPDWSAGRIAQECQGSAFPSRYDQVSSDADTWLEAWSGQAAASSSDGSWYTKSYQYARNADEDSWTAMQRLASEVHWRCFVVGRSLYFMSEPELYARRPRYQVTPEDPSVLELDYSVDWGKPTSEATLEIALDRWGAPPGSVIVLDGFGPPDGRWLVSQVDRDWFAPVAQLTLVQPGKALLEPASERAQRAQNAAGGSGVAVDAGGSKGGQVYNAAQAISAKHYPYVWGGGHARAGRPDGGTGRDPGIGYDCSGSVCAALAAAGLGFRPGGPVSDSGTIARSWGDPGRGRQFTVWANGEHVWIQWHSLGSAWRFDTSPHGDSSGRGPRQRTTPRETAGFTARHWPGV